MLLIFIRILLSWFPGADFGRPYDFLCALCDPYLAWFRRFRILRGSGLDFSPLIALAVLSLLRGILDAWGTMGRISIAVILLFFLQAFQSIAGWILGFFIVVLVLRMIAYLANSNIRSPFWRLVDYIAQPVMYRISKTFFPHRLVNYLFRIIFSIALLLVMAILLWVLVHFAAALISPLRI